MLAKEDDYMVVLHVRAGFALSLCNIPTHNQNYLNQRMVFTNDRTFVTDEGSYYLSKYRLTDALVKNLKEIHLWAKATNILKI